MVPSSKSGAEIMHLCCIKRDHDYLNLWLTWRDSVLCSGSGYPRWHSSVGNDLKSGLECLCKVVVWHSSVLSGSVLSLSGEHSSNSFVLITCWNRKEEVINVDWGRFLWMILWKGLRTHQQVLLLSLTVLCGAVQHLEGWNKCAGCGGSQHKYERAYAKN